MSLIRSVYKELHKEPLKKLYNTGSKLEGQVLNPNFTSNI